MVTTLRIVNSCTDHCLSVITYFLHSKERFMIFRSPASCLGYLAPAAGAPATFPEVALDPLVIIATRNINGDLY